MSTRLDVHPSNLVDFAILAYGKSIGSRKREKSVFFLLIWHYAGWLFGEYHNGAQVLDLLG